MNKNMFFVNVNSCTEVNRDTEKMVALMKEYDIKGLHMSYEELLRFEKEEFKAILDENGIKLVCVNTVPRLCAKDGTVFEDAVKHCLEALEYISYFGCEFLMPVPFFYSDIDGEGDRQRARERFAEGLRIIASESEKYGIRTVIENISQLILPFSSCEDLEYLFDTVPNLGYCFDTGNFVCTRDNSLNALELFKDKIELVHIKELVSDPEGDLACDSGAVLRHTDFGKGEANLYEIMKKLVAHKPDVPYIIEIQNLHAKKEWVKQACEFFDEVTA